MRLVKDRLNLLEWYRYDLQGTPIFYNAANVQIPSSNRGVRHLFTGQQWYSELGLYDLRNRFYSPDIGRFLQPDPIGFGGDATNLYRYSGNNPVNWSDPDGLDVIVGWYTATGLASRTGHIGAGVNTTQTQGFYGSSTFGVNRSGPYMVGNVLADNPDRLKGSLVIRTNRVQDAIVTKAIAEFNKTPYSLSSRNCATCVATALKTAGVIFPGTTAVAFQSNNLPNVLFQNLQNAVVDPSILDAQFESDMAAIASIMQDLSSPGANILPPNPFEEHIELSLQTGRGGLGFGGGMGGSGSLGIGGFRGFGSGVSITGGGVGPGRVIVGDPIPVDPGRVTVGPTIEYWPVGGGLGFPPTQWGPDGPVLKEE